MFSFSVVLRGALFWGPILNSPMIVVWNLASALWRVPQAVTEIVGGLGGIPLDAQFSVFRASKVTTEPSPGSRTLKEMPGHACTNAQDLWEGEALTLVSLKQGLQAPAPP